MKTHPLTLKFKNVRSNHYMKPFQVRGNRYWYVEIRCSDIQTHERQGYTIARAKRLARRSGADCLLRTATKRNRIEKARP
jgi:hypothetical protein